jgi:hypothetical protein
MAPTTGFVLRIFSCGAANPVLAMVAFDQCLTGEQRRNSESIQFPYDALIPWLWAS